MNKAKVIKVLLWIAIILVVAVFITLWQIDRIAAASIRTVGSAVTGTEVQVKSVSISPLRGVVKVDGFQLGNPAGFHLPFAVKAGTFHVDANMSSLFSDEMHVEYLELSGIDLNFELKLTKGSNFDVILDNVKKNTGADKEKPEADKPEEEESDKPAQKVVLDKLVLKDIKVRVTSTTAKTSLVIPLAPITMENVGGGQGIGEAIEEILSRIILEVGKVVDFKKLGGAVVDAGEAALKNIDKATSGVGDAVVSAGESAGSAVKGALDKSRNLIKSLPGVGR